MELLENGIVVVAALAASLFVNKKHLHPNAMAVFFGLILLSSFWVEYSHHYFHLLGWLGGIFGAHFFAESLKEVRLSELYNEKRAFWGGLLVGGLAGGLGYLFIDLFVPSVNPVVGWALSINSFPLASIKKQSNESRLKLASFTLPIEIFAFLSAIILFGNLSSASLALSIILGVVSYLISRQYSLFDAEAPRIIGTALSQFVGHGIFAAVGIGLGRGDEDNIVFSDYMSILFYFAKLIFLIQAASHFNIFDFDLPLLLLLLPLALLVKSIGGMYFLGKKTGRLTIYRAELFAVIAFQLGAPQEFVFVGILPALIFELLTHNSIKTIYDAPTLKERIPFLGKTI